MGEILRGKKVDNLTYVYYVEKKNHIRQDKNCAYLTHTIG